MYQVHFWNSSWFLNELGPCFLNATQGQAFLVFVCVFTKVSLIVYLTGKGTEIQAVWAGRSANTDSARIIVWDWVENERPAHTANTPSCSSVKLTCVCMCACMCPCTCARDSCGQIQIWGHTLSQCSLFSFPRYVNSNAKACIWCTCKVYPKGEGS